MAKPKKRAEQYERPLAVKGSFQQLVKLSITNIDNKKVPVQEIKKRRKVNFYNIPITKLL